MKYLMVVLTLLSGSLLAQSGLQLATQSDIQSGQKLSVPPGSSPAYDPSYSQLYCAGFVTRRAIPRTNFVVGSKESPLADSFAGHTELFLGGPGLVAGERYSILRQIADPNHETSSPEQENRLEKLGAIYEEVGWVTVTSIIKGTAVANFDFSCDATIRGDIIVPFKEKPTLDVRKVDPPMDPFRAPSRAVKGHILGGKDFVGLLGTGQVVYTDFGTAKGAKAGDYLVVLRGSSAADLNQVDRLSEQLPRGANADFMVVNPAHVKAKADSRIPQRVLGEMLVLEASATASTAIITRSFSEMQLGDLIESESDHSQRAKTKAAKAVKPASDCRLRTRLHQKLLLYSPACNEAKAAKKTAWTQSAE